MAGVEKKTTEEEYYHWKQNLIYLYDCMISHSLAWPSMTVQWFPSVKDGFQNLLLGTFTSGADQEQLLVARVPFKLISHQDVEHEAAVEVCAQFPHKGEVNKARHMPQDANIVATQSSLGLVCIYDIDPLKKLEEPCHVFREHSKEGYGLAWNQASKGLLLSASNDSSICLWDLKAGLLASTFMGHKGGVQDVAWHDANLFCSVGEDAQILLWDSRSKDKPVDALEGHSECTNCVDFNKLNEHIMAAGSADATISIWDLRSTKYKQCSLEQHKDEVISSVWSPHKESLLASGDKGGKAMVWDLARLGEEISKEDAEDGMPELIFTHGGHRNAVADLQWNPQVELLLASVDQDNVLQIWQMDKTIYEEIDEDPENIKDDEVE